MRNLDPFPTKLSGLRINENSISGGKRRSGTGESSSEESWEDLLSRLGCHKLSYGKTEEQPNWNLWVMQNLDGYISCIHVEGHRIERIHCKTLKERLYPSKWWKHPTGQTASLDRETELIFLVAFGTLLWYCWKVFNLKCSSLYRCCLTCWAFPAIYLFISDRHHLQLFF